MLSLATLAVLVTLAVAPSEERIIVTATGVSVAVKNVFWPRTRATPDPSNAMVPTDDRPSVAHRMRAP